VGSEVLTMILVYTERVFLLTTLISGY